MQEGTNSKIPAAGSTQIFRMPAADQTVPDMMGGLKPAEPTLTIVKGPHAGETFKLSGDVITLGRDTRSSVFLNDMTVSRNHARIDLTNIMSGHATIEDLGSLNGTWVDGAITTKTTLHDGSTIQVGTFRMVFHTNDRPHRIGTEG